MSINAAPLNTQNYSGNSKTTHNITIDISDGTNRATAARISVPNGISSVSSVILDPSGAQVAFHKQVDNDGGIPGHPTPSIWTIADSEHPAAGTYTLQVLLTGSRAIEATIQTWEDVSQAGLNTEDGLSALGLVPTPTSGTGTSASITVPSEAGGLVIDALSESLAQDLTLTATQTEDYKNGLTGRGSGFSHAAGDTSVVMGWNFSGGPHWAQVAIALAPAETDTNPTINISEAGLPLPINASYDFNAIANDAEDADLTDSIEWSIDDSAKVSIIGNTLGGNTTVKRISPGAAVLTATITDSDLNTSTASVTISDPGLGFDKARFAIRALGGII